MLVGRVHTRWVSVRPNLNCFRNFPQQTTTDTVFIGEIGSLGDTTCHDQTNSDNKQSNHRRRPGLVHSASVQLVIAGLTIHALRLKVHPDERVNNVLGLSNGGWLAEADCPISAYRDWQIRENPTGGSSWTNRPTKYCGASVDKMDLIQRKGVLDAIQFVGRWAHTTAEAPGGVRSYLTMHP
ncbi:hypothetical protein BDN71DRAFT_1429694 [Pleurotus eryngii]|uniref:Uncharacterized protein n=1 Tax=Pleurotus eryngii TaxID=5323 RepID=A0A9P6A2M4_PLEER|nr:hypothetical protein BDN71DRAFT_1429694 [Pleurotus eryngii]